MNQIPAPPTKRTPALLALCIILWVITPLLSFYSLWLLEQPGSEILALLALVVAVVTAGAGYGLYQARRWGVVLFGILCLIGSVNHLSNSVQRFSAIGQTGAEVSLVLARIISVLGAFLIPFFLIYLLLLLWRQTR